MSGRTAAEEMLRLTETTTDWLSHVYTAVVVAVVVGSAARSDVCADLGDWRAEAIDGDCDGCVGVKVLVCADGWRRSVLGQY